MSTPPSFQPNPKRRRPGSDDVHVVGQEAPSGAPVPPPEAIAPQMWRISEDGADSSRPLMPPTLDQPQRDPSSLFPRRSAPVPPPSFAPGSAPRKSVRSPRSTQVPAPSSSPERTSIAPSPDSARDQTMVAPGPAASLDETTVAPNPPSFAPGSAPTAGGRTGAPRSYAPGSGQPTSAAPSFAPGSGQPTSAAPSFAPGSGSSGHQVTVNRSAPSTPPTRAPQPSAPSTAPRPRRKRRRHLVLKTLSLLLVLILAWGGFLVWDANSNIGRVSALTGSADTPGTTYLLAGSDSRADGAVQDGFEGSERADSIMLVNVAPNGQAVALSIPRDTYAEIPGVGWDKINASYAYGGPQLLVETVEKLTGLTVDHFVQIGMGAVPDMVDAVGGVELCYDHDANDEYSGLNWTAGCHTVDGTTALQFSRMRYQDPEGDIGRTKRQRQVISKVVSAAASPATLINPARTLKVERAGSKSFTVDEDSSIFTVGSLVLALRSASSEELMGVPPIESLDYTTSAGASAVLLRDETAPDFFEKLRTGKLTSSDLNQVG